MPTLRYMGKDEDGEAIWVESKKARHTTNKPCWEKMTTREKALAGYRNMEDKGWKSAFSKNEVKRIWGA